MYGILYLTYTVQAEVGLYLGKTQYILSSYLCTLTIFLSEHISLDNKKQHIFQGFHTGVIKWDDPFCRGSTLM